MMKAATRTMLVWSGYLVILGATLVIAPNVLLGLFGIPATTEVWIRIVGVLVLILAYYCYAAASIEHEPFYRWSVRARSSVIVFFAVFVGLGLADPMLLLFGAIDLAGALWTASALRKATAAQAI
jgi:hypothetical protein